MPSASARVGARRPDRTAGGGLRPDGKHCGRPGNHVTRRLLTEEGAGSWPARARTWARPVLRRVLRAALFAAAAELAARAAAPRRQQPKA